eukprot:8702349-Pyramimonas_sp.AAC.1
MRLLRGGGSHNNMIAVRIKQIERRRRWGPRTSFQIITFLAKVGVARRTSLGGAPAWHGTRASLPRPWTAVAPAQGQLEGGALITH